MTFTFEQLDALAIGLSFVEVAGDASLSQAAQEVRAKLQASLPEPEKRTLENAPLFASRRQGRAASVLKTVRRSIREAEVLRLQYSDGEENQTERRVRPVAIWAFTDGWLFVGWCELRSDFRAFRLDRISVIEATGEHFANELGKTLPTYLSTKFLKTQNL